MTHGKSLLLCAFLLFSAVPPAFCGDFKLVEEGKAGCVIVVGEDDEFVREHSMERSEVTWFSPAELVKSAGEDMGRILAEMGGLAKPEEQIRIVDSVEEAKGAKRRVLLGSAAVKEYGLGEEAAGLSYSGYIYRVVGNDLLIFGSSCKGTANGVYGFLQDELGVRWFGAPELFWDIPQRETVEVGELDRHVEPSFHGRFGGEGRIEHPSAYWARRLMRMTETFDSGEPYANVGHNMHRRLFRAQTYAQEHPEWYGKRGGSREIHPPGYHNWNLCWSNPEIVDVAVKGALEFFGSDERNHSYSLAINDAPAYCECEGCEALQPERYYGDGRSGARGGRVASDMYFHFVNEVARQVGKEYPDRVLGVIAYRDVVVPPVGDVEPNVHVAVVNDVSEYFDREIREADRELMDQWGKKDCSLGMYYYTGLAKMVPAYWPELLGEVLKEEHKRGLVALCTEESPVWPLRGPMGYVETRLWWDVDLDVKELLEEYFTKLYGDAAEPMRAMYERLEEIHMRPRVGGFLYEHYKLLQFRPYTREDLEEIRRLLSEAHRLAGEISTGHGGRGDLEGRRVAYVSRGMKVFLEMLEGLVLADELEADTGEIDELRAYTRLEKVERIQEILDGHEALYRETITLDPTQPGRFSRDTATPMREHWKRQVSEKSSSALAKLMEWRTGINIAPRSAQRIDSAVGKYRDGSAEKVILDLMAGAAEKGENLVSNPDFEEVAKSGESKAALPVGWQTSTNAHSGGGAEIGTIVLTDGERQGQRVGRIAAANTRAYLLATIPGVRPGATYVFEADALLDKGQETEQSPGRVNMTIRWRGEDGWIKEGRAVSNDLGAENEWLRLRIVGRAPKGAVTARLFLFAEGMRFGESALFDNVFAARVFPKTDRNQISGSKTK